MSKKITTTIKISLFVCFGIAIFWLVYKDFDFANFFETISEINFWWLIPVTVLSILSHLSRARRWQLLLESTGSKPNFANTFLAVLNAYFANLAIPRLGEVTRCAVIAKYEKHDFSKVLGTVVSERLLDLIMVALLTVTAFATQGDVFYNFIEQHPEIKQHLSNILNPLTITLLGFTVIAVVVVIIVIAKGKLNRFRLCAKISEFIRNFWQGILCLKNLKHKVGVIIHSLLIWTLYFLMLYLCFFAFNELENLSVLTALMLFVASSFGMIVPSPNGMGSYHFMIIQTLLLYGISENSGATFAIVAHSFQTLLIIVLGLISTILIPIINKSRK